MANSAAKAEALKNSYVSSIVDEFGKGNLPKATGIEPLAQETASVHLSPNTGEIGGINDNDPSSYIHYNDGTTLKGPSKPEFANPAEGAPGSGAFEVDKMDPGLQQQMNRQDEIRRGLTTGPMAGIAPGLAGKLGMEQGRQASVVVGLDDGTSFGRNDGDPTLYIARGNKTVPLHMPKAAYPMPNQRPGATDLYRFKNTPYDRGQFGIYNKLYNENLRGGNYFINRN